MNDYLHLEVTGIRRSGMRTADLEDRVLIVEVAISEDQMRYLGLELGDTMRVARPDLSILDDRPAV